MGAGTLDGNAIVYCEGVFGTSTGKTAHGLVRRTSRYRVIGVIDGRLAGRDAGEVLDGRRVGIPLQASLGAALEAARETGTTATHFVVGIATDGGRLPAAARAAVLDAIHAGLNVDSGLHDFLSDDAEIAAAAASRGVKLRDIRKTPARGELHGFTGKIGQVGAFRIAVLGTDAAVGKRTTAWKLVEGLERSGHRAAMVGTGQTAWLQGVRHGIVLDSLVNDFVAGELEHAVWSCWNDEKPEFIVIEGQGSLLNPAYPGGLEIVAASRPHAIVLQHAPSRHDYEGFEGYPIHPLPLQRHVLELLSGKPVIAITLNHEGLEPVDVPRACEAISNELDLPCTDVLLDGPDALVKAVLASKPTPSGGGR